MQNSGRSDLTASNYHLGRICLEKPCQIATPFVLRVLLIGKGSTGAVGNPTRTGKAGSVRIERAIMYRYVYPLQLTCIHYNPRLLVHHE